MSFGAVHSKRTCRQCPAEFEWAPDDPAPDLCEDCFADRMAVAVPYVQSLLLALPSAEALAEARKYLREVALLDDAVTDQLLGSLEQR